MSDSRQPALPPSSAPHASESDAAPLLRKVRWARRPRRRLPTRGAVHAAVVFDRAGACYIADLAGSVQSFAPDGRPRWRVQLDGGISATPAICADRATLVVGTHTGAVYGLDTAAGATRWRQTVPSATDPRILSPLQYLPRTGCVVLSSWGGQFHALTVDTGATRFSWDAGVFPRAAAVLDAEENLYCLRARPGRGVEWFRVDALGHERVLFTEPEDALGARRTLVAAAPVPAPGGAVAYLVLNHARGASLLACSVSSGAVVWRLPLPAAIQATPTAMPSGTIVLADLSGSIQGVSPEGATLFRYATGADYLLAPGVGWRDGVFLIGDPGGRLLAVDERGRGAAVFETSRSLQAPLSFDPSGQLYVPGTDRGVVVFAPPPG